MDRARLHIEVCTSDTPNTGGEEAGRFFGRPRSSGESRTQHASLPGIIVVMAKARQVGIESDHLWCEAEGNDFSRPSPRGHLSYVACPPVFGVSEVQNSICNLARSI